jgi:anti-sigma-K factor RskA
MSPTDPELIDRLASEYVLGTLRGPARRRFERWRSSSTAIDERCRFWEEQLLPLTRRIKPITPSTHLWRGISERLNLTSAAPRRAPTRLRTFALAASVLLVAALGAVWFLQPSGPGRITQLATRATAGTSTPPAGEWLSRRHRRSESMRV